MAAHKPIDEAAFKAAIVRHKGYLKAIARELGVSTFKIDTMIDLHYKPSEIAAIRGEKIRKL